MIFYDTMLSTDKRRRHIIKYLRHLVFVACVAMFVLNFIISITTFQASSPGCVLH